MNISLLVFGKLLWVDDDHLVWPTLNSVDPRLPSNEETGKTRDWAAQNGLHDGATHLVFVPKTKPR